MKWFYFFAYKVSFKILIMVFYVSDSAPLDWRPDNVANTFNVY